MPATMMRASVVTRTLEILPTAAVWLIITAPLWAAVVAPAALGTFLILFSVYWLWKSTTFASGVLIGFWRLHQAQKRDWLAAERAPQRGEILATAVTGSLVKYLRTFQT